MTFRFIGFDVWVKRTMMTSSKSSVSATSSGRRHFFPLEKKIVCWSISYMALPLYNVVLLRAYVMIVTIKNRAAKSIGFAFFLLLGHDTKLWADSLKVEAKILDAPSASGFPPVLWIRFTNEGFTPLPLDERMRSSSVLV